MGFTTRFTKQDNFGAPKLSDQAWTQVSAGNSANSANTVSYGGSKPAPTTGIPFVAIP